MDNIEGSGMLPVYGADGFGQLILWYKIPMQVGDIIATMEAPNKDTHVSMFSVVITRYLLPKWWQQFTACVGLEGLICIRLQHTPASDR
jgi:hypothetical protein